MTKISAEIAELLETRIDSFEKLEIVVALHGAPHTTLTISELSRKLAMPRDEVRQAALELHDAALVTRTTRGIQLLPPTDRDQQTVDALVELYAYDRIPLVRALGAIAVERIRTMAARTFADAFVIKRRTLDDPDD